MQRCTHPRYPRCEITNIHAAQRDMTCVLPASLLRFGDIADRFLRGEGVALHPRQLRAKTTIDGIVENKVLHRSKTT